MAWEKVLSIIEEARQDHRDAETTAPQACPNDGEPLREGPNGELFCISDGWTWEG